MQRVQERHGTTIWAAAFNHVHENDQLVFATVAKNLVNLYRLEEPSAQDGAPAVDGEEQGVDGTLTSELAPEPTATDHPNPSDAARKGVDCNGAPDRNDENTTAATATSADHLAVGSDCGEAKADQVASAPCELADEDELIKEGAATTAAAATTAVATTAAATTDAATTDAATNGAAQESAPKESEASKRAAMTAKARAANKRRRNNGGATRHRKTKTPCMSPHKPLREVVCPLQSYADEDEGECFYTLDWGLLTRPNGEHDVLLAVAGERRHIKLIDVHNCDVHTVLQGHGEHISLSLLPHTCQIACTTRLHAPH